MPWSEFMLSLSRRIIALVIISCYLAGCSFFAPSVETMGVSTDPPGAKVLVSGRPVGESPVHFEVHRGDNVLIEVQKPGYQTQFRTPSRTLSSVGIADVVGGAILLLPLLGLLSSGAWKHDPSEYGITLEPKEMKSGQDNGGGNR